MQSIEQFREEKIKRIAEVLSESAKATCALVYEIVKLEEKRPRICRKFCSGKLAFLYLQLRILREQTRMQLCIIYSQHLRPIPNFPIGGVNNIGVAIVGESGNEIIVTNQGQRELPKHE